MNTYDDMRPEPEQEPAAEPRSIRGVHRRMWARVVAGVGVCILAVVVGLAVYLNSNAGHRYLIQTVQRKASESMGVQVEFQNFALHLPTLSLDLYGIRVAGASPYSDQPLLQVDHVHAGVRIISVFGAKWYLDNLQIDHPVAWVLVDKNGKSNLPTFQSSGTSHTDVFQLGVRHVTLQRGEVYYNSRPSALAAELHDLDFTSSFDSLRTEYSGKLAYAKGQLLYGTFRPFEHDFEAEFQATPTAFNLNHAEIRSGSSNVILSGTATNYANPAIEANYNITADGSEMARLLKEPSIPAGLIKMSGSLQFQQAANQPLLQALAVSGDASSSELRFNTATIHSQARNVVAHYSLANGNATLRDFRADLLGGGLTAAGSIQALSGDSHASFHADLRRISLAALQHLSAHSASTNAPALAGEANATATATWGKTLNDLVAHADATVNGQVTRAANGGALVAGAGSAPPASANSTAIPIDGAFHAIYANDRQTLTFNNSSLRSAQTNLALNGTVSKSSRLTVDLQANDLREVAPFIDLFRTSGATGAQLDLAGRAAFHGTVQGSTVAPHLSGQLTADNLHYNGTDWKILRAQVDASPSRIDLKNTDLEAQARGKISGSVSAGLQQWSFTKQSSIQIALNASQVSLATLARLSGQQFPVTGTMNAELDVHGEVANPEGSGTIALTKVTAYEQPISVARLDFKGSGNQAQGDLSIQTPAGAVLAKVTVEPQQKTFSAQVNSSGIDLAKLQALQARNIDAKGNLAIQARGQGSFDNPQLDATLQLPTLTIGGQTISRIKLDMNVANRVANADLTSSFAQTSTHARMRVNLSGDYLTDASFDTPAFPLQPLLAVYAPEQAASFAGQTEIHATLHGPLKDKAHLEAHVAIPTLKLAYGNTIQLAAASPIHIDYQNGVVDLQPATIRGTDTDLQFQGSIPIDSHAPMALKAQGTVNLQLAQLFQPDLRSSGELKLNIDSRGPVASGSLGGEIDVVDANLSSATLPVGLQHGNGVLKLTTDRLEIAKFDGMVGGGPVTAQGAIVYRPKIQFDMGVTAKGLRVLYPQGVRETVNANLRLAGSVENAVLGGSVNIGDLSFTPAFDLSTVIDQFSGGVAAPVEGGFTQNLALNIAVNSSSNANLVSRTLSVGGTANLQVRGTAANPVILGRVNLSSGDVILHGNRFVLTGGTIQFINPAMTEPVLNVSLTTTIQEYKIDLRFNGPSDQLHPQYSSDPALPPADIINLLAFGQTTEASAMNATPANEQAESLVASQVSGQVTSRLSRAAGISQLSISPVLQGNTAAGPPGAQITIQQRVTGNLFVTFSTNVATTQGQVIQGQYQVSPRVAFSATRDPNGGFALDTLIKKSW